MSSALASCSRRTVVTTPPACETRGGLGIVGRSFLHRSVTRCGDGGPDGASSITDERETQGSVDEHRAKRRTLMQPLMRYSSENVRSAPEQRSPNRGALHETSTGYSLDEVALPFNAYAECHAQLPCRNRAASYPRARFACRLAASQQPLKVQPSASRTLPNRRPSLLFLWVVLGLIFGDPTIGIPTKCVK